MGVDKNLRKLRVKLVTRIKAHTMLRLFDIDVTSFNLNQLTVFKQQANPVIINK